MIANEKKKDVIDKHSEVLVASWMTTDKKTMSSEGVGQDCLGWAAKDASGVLSPYKFSRRTLGNEDVHIKITHCGVCYADVIWTRNKHGDSKYPVVPGHEIAGIVTKVGSNVHSLNVGDHVGVGVYVNSCRDCEYCNDRQEVHCSKGPLPTFNGVDFDGTITKGGYSSYIVVHERYCLKIPKSYPLASAAPLLCAGITVYSPMVRHKMNQPGKSLGVIGLGGLGHMAVKFGKAFGLSVTVFSTSISKKEEALSLLGADKFVVSSNQEEMAPLAKSLDFIIDTASGDHPFDPYMSLLKTYGVFVLVSFPSEVKFRPASLNFGTKTVAGSVTGGTKEMQEMIDFCAANGIHPNVEVIPIDYANEALERLIKRDIKYRFVIDIDNSLKET
ncbi:putative cinnamyl alcohol dehydrogenase 1, partial [Mucuna pruriens]